MWNPKKVNKWVKICDNKKYKKEPLPPLPPTNIQSFYQNLERIHLTNFARFKSCWPCELNRVYIFNVLGFV